MFGAGAVGMAAVFAAAYVGIKTIVIVDLLDSRLELAKSLGATHSINGKDKGKRRSTIAKEPVGEDCLMKTFSPLRRHPRPADRADRWRGRLLD